MTITHCKGAVLLFLRNLDEYSVPGALFECEGCGKTVFISRETLGAVLDSDRVDQDEPILADGKARRLAEVMESARNIRSTVEWHEYAMCRIPTGEAAQVYELRRMFRL